MLLSYSLFWMSPVHSLCPFSVPGVNTRHHVAFGQQPPQSPPVSVIFMVFLSFFPTKITIFYTKISQILACHMTPLMILKLLKVTMVCVPPL